MCMLEVKTSDETKYGCYWSSCQMNFMLCCIVKDKESYHL